MFRLAAMLGRTVGELADTMDASEFVEWIAFDSLSPIGGERSDLIYSMMASLIATVNSKKRFRPHQFAPKWGRTPKGSSSQAIRDYFLALKQRQDDQRTKLEEHKRRIAAETDG